MAENSDAVYKLLNQLLEAYTPTAQKEYLEVQEPAREEQGDDFIVMPWDWSYYSNKLKNKKFNINEEMLRPYFELEQVKKRSIRTGRKTLRNHFPEKYGNPGLSQRC